MSKPKIYFRADGNAQIGMGHIMRCLALADYVDDAFEVFFICKDPDQTVVSKIDQQGYSLVKVALNDFEQELDFLSQNYFDGNEILVVDGYSFDLAYSKKCRKIVGKLILIDDLEKRKFECDLLINHSILSITRNENLAHTRYLLGPKYALINKIFQGSEQKNREKVFVCFGGVDRHNYTFKVLEKILPHIQEKELLIIMGAHNQNENQILSFLQNTEVNYTIKKNLSQFEMAKEMGYSSLAFCSSSTVAYEYAATYGELYIVKTEDNQKHLFETMLNAKIALDFKDYPERDEKKIEASFLQQKICLDGLVDERFMKFFSRLQKEINCELRLATNNDCLQYLEWANDPDTRSNSLNSALIVEEDHIAWFDSKLTSTSSDLYVLEYMGNAVGQIRFEKEEKICLINYSVAKESRGEGLGYVLLALGIEKIHPKLPEDVEMVGIVKKSNFASLKVFRTFSFSEIEEDENIRFVLNY